MLRTSFWITFPFFARFLVWIILPAAAVGVVLYSMFSNSLPKASGTLRLAGPTAPVTILRDTHSVPQIQASNPYDAYFALGFVHAQDRLWQMEMNRRTCAGRLSEILGSSALRSDVVMRRLGLYANARKIWRSLDPENKKILQIYVDGINAGAANLGTRPIEFHLLRFTPEPWLPEDSLALMQLLTFQLSSNMGAEIRRLLLTQNSGSAIAAELMPAAAKQVLALGGPGAPVDTTLFSAFNVERGPFGPSHDHIGSNSWVVSGKHTASGLPMLANDPHLGTPIPSDWYLARISGGPLQADGGTLPGLPFVVIGRNAHIAWGMTNMKADTQDIVLEDVNPLNKDQYLVGTAYQNMDVQYEQIKIKGDFLRPAPEPELVKIRRTRNGPMISDSSDQIEKRSYSLRWTADDDTGGTFNSFVKISYAKNWTEFNAALESYVAPIHNFVYADKMGNIGSVAPGLYPVRKTSDGSLPVLGGSAGGVWQGWLAFADVPRSYNPPQGYLVAANNRIVAPDYPFHITTDWAPGYRAARIGAVLDTLIGSGKKIDAAQMQALQVDVVAPAAASGILGQLRQLAPKTAQQASALRLLQQWDGQMLETSPAASLFASWSSHVNAIIMERMLSDPARAALPSDILAVWTTSDNESFVEKVLVHPDRKWCKRWATGANASCDPIMALALERALNELSKTLGSDMTAWDWGRLHKTQYTHFPFSSVKLSPGMPYVDDGFLSTVFDRSLRSSGGNNTVNVAPVSFDKDTKYLQFSGPMYRQVVDLGDGAASVFVQGTGQSGNPLSAHYDDLIPIHRKGQYLPMAAPTSDASLRLMPLAQ